MGTKEKHDSLLPGVCSLLDDTKYKHYYKSNITGAMVVKVYILKHIS